MSEAGTATSSNNARLQLNLNVLKRHDASIVEIVDSTSFVVLYRWGADDDDETELDNQWHKIGLEGTMFLFRRARPPLYGIFVLNRNGLNNFTEDLVDEAYLELTPEFIIVKTPHDSQDDDRIHGIWVFEEEHRERIAQRMVELCRLSKAAQPLPQQVSIPAALPLPSSAPPKSNPPAGQSISLDALFGTDRISPTNRTAEAVPVRAALQAGISASQAESGDANVDDQHAGLSLLDSLFSNAALSRKPASTGNLIDNSPTVSKRLMTAQTNVHQAVHADETALKTLLGLTESPSGLAAPNQPQTQQNLGRSRGPLPIPGGHLLDSARNIPASLTQALPTQNVPQQAPKQQNLPHPSQRGQGGVNPSYPQVAYQHQYPSTMYANVKSAPSEQYAPPPPRSNPVPLMPSVLLNKNRGAAAPAFPPPSAQTQPQNQYFPVQSDARSQPVVGAEQGQRDQPGHVHNVLALSQKGSQAASNSQSSGVVPPRLHSQPYEHRSGAASIPPPPVPPMASRPQQSLPSPTQLKTSTTVQSTNLDGQQQSSPSNAYLERKTTTPSQHATALDLLEAAMHHNSIRTSAYTRATSTMDRRSFSDHIYKLLGDGRFMEDLYQSYLARNRSD